jgi:hypothetical protein
MAAKSGDKTQAFELLSRALAAEPRHEIGWLWLSGVMRNCWTIYAKLY